ncbi:MAG: Mth938-like domain-containing protein [Xanthomonadales bacterium]|nr:Mth938-like domain-containing protein [Xanthomonadales bacterium]
MDLIHERPDFEYVLRGADGSRVLVNDRTLTSSCIVAPDRLVADWPVATMAQLDDAALAALFDLQPDVILLGTGERQAFPPPPVMAAALQRGIGLEPMTNAACARTYNVLAGEGRKVVAAFVLPG